MRSKKLARRYGIALGELAYENEALDDVERELAVVQQAFTEEPALRRALESENITVEVKKTIIREAFGNQLSRLTLNFLLLVISKRRESALMDMIEEFRDYADEKKGIVEVQLTTAEKLEPVQFEAIANQLSKMLGKEIRLSAQEDPDLLGGIIARIGDMVLDGSVKTRLNVLGQQLKRAQLN